MGETPMPRFTILAQDALAVPVLEAYREECLNHGLSRQAYEVNKALEEFRWWQETNSDKTKLPFHKHVPEITRRRDP